MRGVRNIYHHCYTFSILFVFVFFILFHHALSINTNTLSSTESLTLSSNRTIVSPGDNFELGFFKPGGTSSCWYLGMWYKKLPKRTYAWVANRDNPLLKSIGALKISNHNLVIVDQNDKPVWSTNLTKEDVSSPVVAELLENGNFMLRYSENNDPNAFLWQSFDFPTDTLLPEMKLGYNLKTGHNRYLTSWRSLDDPSSGSFSYKLENRGFPEFFLYKNDIRIHRSGPWNGIGIPEEHQLDYMFTNFTENAEEVAYMFQVTNHNIQTRLTLSNEGVLHQLTWIPPSRGWIQLWSSPMDTRCELYQTCGAYSYCDTNMLPKCKCMRGFEPMSMQEWELSDGSRGCVRRTPLCCGGDEFLRMEKMKLPDTTMATVMNKRIGVQECKKMCLRDCNCTAYANTDIRNGGFGCVIWTGELLDVRNYDSAGQDLYVRVAASNLEGESYLSRRVKGFFTGISVVFLLIVITLCLW